MIRRGLLTTTAIATATIAPLLLSACQVEQTERPSAPTTFSPESITPVPTPSSDLVDVVDTSAGGPIEYDPLAEGLAQASHNAKQVYLSVHLHVPTEVPSSGQVALTPDTPNSVTMTVDAEAIDAASAPFLHVTGTFSVAQDADSAYTLTTVDTEAKPELEPQGPNTEERCTAEDINPRAQDAAQTLADTPDKREDLRLQWGASPEVWWGIQRTASTMRDSDGEYSGDFLTEACQDYL